MKICLNCQQTYTDDVVFCARDGSRLANQAPQHEEVLAAGLARRFSIVRQLGEGGMGTVFLARQVGVGNRLVALKVLNRKLLDDPEFLQRFQAEAGSTGAIHHPNVVTIHESGQADDGTPYIAMEFLDGESLRDVLKKVGTLSINECGDILMQAARGLNAAHRLGIIHRDLKPDNIYLTRGDEGEPVVKVLDFGIAKLREATTHTLTGMVLGTPPYMSCDQASGMPSDELDARSDIYSLGVVTYEMLCGRVPFYSTTPLGYVHKHMLEAPPSFSTVDPHLAIPPEVEAVVMKSLKKKREERYTSALEFARAFMAAAHPGMAPTTSSMDVQTPTPGSGAVRVDTPAPQLPTGAPAVRTHPPLPDTDRVPQDPVAEPPSWFAGAPPASDGPGEFQTPIARLPGGMGGQGGAPPYATGTGASAMGRGPAAPMPWPAAADVAVQTPPAALPSNPVTPVAQLPVHPPGMAPSYPPPAVQPPQPPPSKGLNPVVYAVLGVILLLAIGGGIWVFTRPKPEPNPKPNSNPSGQTTTTGGSTTTQEGQNTPDRMVSIPAGTFMMGRNNATDPEETPAHSVTVAAFQMDRRPVTNARYAQYVNSSGHAAPSGWVNGAPPQGQEDWPATGVAWDEAAAYCSALGFRLPTEAEWEYGARGTDGRLYPWGNTFSPALTNSAEANLDHPEEVGAHRDDASPFQLLDMSGNVWQWTADAYAPYPGHRATFAIPADAKAIRGGSYKSDKLHVTTTTRNLDHASSRSTTIGFRCAK